MLIRKAEETDLPQINDLFNWHSENGFSTFSETTTLNQRNEWFKRFDSTKHLALVAEDGEKISGIACSFAYRGGGVFKDTIETSIYLHPNSMGQGLGSKLYDALFNSLKGANVHRVVVGIALPNEGSIRIHRKFGFEDIGVFDEYAYYKGEYRSSLWMQKKL